MGQFNDGVNQSEEARKRYAKVNETKRVGEKMAKTFPRNTVQTENGGANSLTKQQKKLMDKHPEIYTALMGVREETAGKSYTPKQDALLTTRALLNKKQR